MARADRRRQAKAAANQPGLRNLTEAERVQLNELLAPHLQARAEADKLCTAVFSTFCKVLGFPVDVSIVLGTGVMTLPPSPSGGLPPRVPTPPAPAPAPGPDGQDARRGFSGVAKDVPSGNPSRPLIVREQETP